MFATQHVVAQLRKTNLQKNWGGGGLSFLVPTALVIIIIHPPCSSASFTQAFSNKSRPRTKFDLNILKQLY